MDISFEQTVQRIAEATKDLEKLTAELSLQQDTVQQWVSDVHTSRGGRLRPCLRLQAGHADPLPSDYALRRRPRP